MEIVVSTTALVVGFICLVIAIVSERRAARVRRAIEVQLAAIRESNADLEVRIYHQDRVDKDWFAQLKVLVTNQKREINGLYETLRLRMVDLWRSPGEMRKRPDLPNRRMDSGGLDHHGRPSAGSS